MIKHEDQPQFEEGRGADVKAADFAALAARREQQARDDMLVLRSVVHHTTRVQCEWCPGKVARYGSTPDGARHYCRTCINNIVHQFGIELPRQELPTCL